MINNQKGQKANINGIMPDKIRNDSGVALSLHYPWIIIGLSLLYPLDNPTIRKG